MLQELDNKLDQIENIGTVLDEAITVKSELETNISTATKTKSDLATINTNATTTKNDLETLNTNAIQTKSDLDSANVLAGDNKSDLDIKNALATQNIQQMDSFGDVSTLVQNVTELKADKTEILNTIGDETMGVTATTLKGAIAEVKGIADNNTTQLNDIANERGYVNCKRIPNTDLNLVTDSGLYAGNNFINAPDNAITWYFVEVFNCGDQDNYVIQRAMGFANAGTQTFERRKNLDSWTAWKRIVTSTSPTEIAFTTKNDYTIVTDGKGTYTKTSENVVLLNLNLTRSATGGVNQVFGSLPIGYRPNVPIKVTGSVNSSNGLVPCIFIINSNGDIFAKQLPSGVTGFTELYLSASFIGN